MTFRNKLLMKPFSENGGIHPRTFQGIVMHREVSHVNVFETGGQAHLWINTRGSFIDPLELAHDISVPLSLGFLNALASFSLYETRILSGINFQ